MAIGISFLSLLSVCLEYRLFIGISLWEIKLAHCFVDEGLVDLVHIARSGVYKACGGDIVDLPGDTAGIFVNNRFGLWLKDFF